MPTEPHADLHRDFRTFYRREFRPVFALVLSLCRSAADAEDLTQETFGRTYREWDRVASYDDPAAWVRTVAVNLVRSRYRRQLTRSRALARWSAWRAAEDDSAVEIHDDGFWEHVRALPQQQAVAIALFYVDDRSVAEIAAIMDVAEGTVKSHLHRARRSLELRLAGEEGGLS